MSARTRHERLFRGSRFTIHRSRFSAPSSELQAADCRLSTSQCYSLTTCILFSNTCVPPPASPEPTHHKTKQIPTSIEE
jgi:hypothetical protein